MNNKYHAMEYLRNYRFHSIFWKNLMLISCVVLLPFLATLLISTYTYDELQRNETQSYSDEVMTRVTMDINSLLEEAWNASIRCGFEEDVRFFIHGYPTAPGKVLDIVEYLTNAKLFNEEIDSICVYSAYSNSVISNRGRSYYNSFPDKVSIDQWDPEGEAIQIRYLPAGNQGTGERIVFFFRPGYAKDDKTGCIVTYYNMEKLTSRFDYGENIKLLLLHDRHILYDSTGALSGAYVSSAKTLMDTDKNNITIRKALGQYNLEVIVHVDSQPLFEKLESIRLTTVLVVVIAMLGTVFVVFYISRKIFAPITDLLSLLEENHQMDEDNLIQTKDEIGYIRHVMNSTISKNKDIEEELSRRLKLLKKAQAVALQAQINPHFMYNTIDTINWMAIRKIGKGNEVSQMLNILSQLLRYSLGNTDTFVSLEEEINYTKKYLQVQQIRSNYGFDVIWDIPEELGKCNAIKMILQPVVENAIKYGIKPFGDGGVVEIRAIRVNDSIHIFVSDSGVGLTQEETDEINRVINSQVIKESDHIGLSNVNQRINLMFGDEYGVTVSSKINEGTTVELTIPYLQEKKL